MGTRVLAVRIGDKYGPEYEEYLKSKIPNIDFLRKSDDRFKLQWNKVGFMNYPIDEPIVVIDIDILLMNDYMELIEYPIKKGQFLGLNAWWKDSHDTSYSLNGAFYKYYPRDCNYIYRKLCRDPHHWQHHYITNGTTHGPVNGEQYFVEDSVKERLELIYVPSDWFGKMQLNPGTQWINDCNAAYPGDYFYDLREKKFNSNVKLVHFQKTHLLHELWKKAPQEC